MTSPRRWTPPGSAVCIGLGSRAALDPTGLVPHQVLGCWLRSLGPLGTSAYLAYRQACGPAEITDVAHLATSVAVHPNYVGVQAELLLDDELPEQHGFARSQVSGAAQSLPSLRGLEEWVKELRA